MRYVYVGYLGNYVELFVFDQQKTRLAHHLVTEYLQCYAHHQAKMSLELHFLRHIFFNSTSLLHVNVSLYTTCRPSTGLDCDLDKLLLLPTLHSGGCHNRLGEKKNKKHFPLVRSWILCLIHDICYPSTGNLRQARQRFRPLINLLRTKKI